MSFGCYHTHSFYCDGSMWPEDYVKRAIELGFKAIGFSGHAPVNLETDWLMKRDDLPKYIEDIKCLKDKYKDDIEVYLGLEIDYIKGISSPKDRCFKELNLDYHIGSIHFLQCGKGQYLTVDGSVSEFDELLDKGFNNDIKALVKTYYQSIREMVNECEPNIVGHLDLVKKMNGGNRYFDENESWYVEEVIKTLNVIEDTSCILEVNTGGKARGYTEEFYPSNWILKEAFNRNIQIVLNADAHNPDSIDVFYKDAVNVLKDAGYKAQRVLYKGIWQNVEL